MYNTSLIIRYCSIETVLIIVLGPSHHTAGYCHRRLNMRSERTVCFGRCVCFSFFLFAVCIVFIELSTVVWCIDIAALGSILYKGQAKCSQSISVSQEFIRQLQSVADFSSDSLTVFPSLLWELPVLTMKSVIDFAELNYTDTNREFNSEVPLVEKFLDEQVFVSLTFYKL